MIKQIKHIFVIVLAMITTINAEKKSTSINTSFGFSLYNQNDISEHNYINDKDSLSCAIFKEDIVLQIMATHNYKGRGDFINSFKKGFLGEGDKQSLSSKFTHSIKPDMRIGNKTYQTFHCSIEIDKAKKLLTVLNYQNKKTSITFILFKDDYEQTNETLMNFISIKP